MDSERVELFRAFLDSRLWKEYIRPEYEKWLATDLEALIESEVKDGEHRGSISTMRQVFAWFFQQAKAQEKAERRGRVQRLRRLLSWPKSEVEESASIQQREENLKQEAARIEHFAQHGFKTPIRPPNP